MVYIFCDDFVHLVGAQPGWLRRSMAVRGYVPDEDMAAVPLDFSSVLFKRIGRSTRFVVKS